MILFFYLARNFIKTFFMISLFVLALILIVDGIDQYGIVKGYGATLLECVLYVLLRIPTNIYQFLPLIVLISALVFFLNLSKHSELVAMRASGVSAARIVLVPVIMTTIIGLITIGPFNSILVGSRNMTDNYLDSFQGNPPQIVRTVKDGVWLREAINNEVRFVYVPAVNWKNKVFSNAEFFIKKDGLDITHIISKKAKIDGGNWILNNPEIYQNKAKNTKSTQKQLKLPTDFKFESIFSTFLDPTKIKNMELPDFISKLDRDGYDIKPSKTYLFSELAVPVFLVLMVLIGSVFALAPLRGGGTSMRTVSAISAGFIFFGMTKLTESMAKAGDIPILLGVLVIPVAGILFATSLLLHQEDG